MNKYHFDPKIYCKQIWAAIYSLVVGVFWSSFYKMKLSIIATILLIFIQPVWAKGKVPVFVSILPQQFFVQQIGKELVDVRVMVQPGENPALYEPKPKQMAALSHAEIYFAVGVPFEKTWLRKIAAANPNMLIVHTDQGIRKMPLQIGHASGEGVHHHESGSLDPHIWLSPPLVKIQTRTALKALQEVDPSNRFFYETNYNAFMAVVSALDDELRTIFKDRQGLQFMVFHPSWGYFAHTYGLKQVPVEIEGKKPKPSQLKQLIEHARAKGIKVIFVQPQFSSKSAEVVANEIGGSVVFADPLAWNWSQNLLMVAQMIKKFLK
jgi:zinc transport system substrate-binding protein